MCMNLMNTRYNSLLKNIKLISISEQFTCSWVKQINNVKISILPNNLYIHWHYNQNAD